MQQEPDNDATHPGLTYPAALSATLQIHPSNNFKRIGKRPGGTSLSSAIYENPQKQIFLGKCTLQYWPSQGVNQNALCNLFSINSLLEILAHRIFTYYGASTALTELAYLQPRIHYDTMKYFFPKNPKTSMPECINVMSKWIEGFIPYGQFPNFDGKQQQHYLQINKTQIPVVGLGQILAIGCFLNDEDLIGGDGNNIGYQIRNVGGQSYALIYKIDFGHAFWNRHQSEEIEKRITSRQIRGSKGRDEINFSDLPFSVRQEFLLTLHAIINTSDEFELPDDIVSFLKKIRQWLKQVYQKELQETQDLYKKLCSKFLKYNNLSAIPLHQKIIKYSQVNKLSERYMLHTLLMRSDSLHNTLTKPCSTQETLHTNKPEQDAIIPQDKPLKHTSSLNFDDSETLQILNLRLFDLSVTLDSRKIPEDDVLLTFKFMSLMVTAKMSLTKKNLFGIKIPRFNLNGGIFYKDISKEDHDKLSNGNKLVPIP